MEAIVAMDNYGAIGADNGLLIHDKEDLQHFRRITMGCQCIVGRKTAANMPELKGRRVIPVSREFSRGYCYEEILCMAEMSARTIVIGGTEIYELFWDDITIFHVTQFDIDLTRDADTFFDYQRLDEEFTLLPGTMSDGGGSSMIYATKEKYTINRTYDTYVRK